MYVADGAPAAGKTDVFVLTSVAGLPWPKGIVHGTDLAAGKVTVQLVEPSILEEELQRLRSECVLIRARMQRVPPMRRPTPGETNASRSCGMPPVSHVDRRHRRGVLRHALDDHKWAPRSEM